jgi:predicted TIM-barrel fold metal-dependent hydrolase
MFASHFPADQVSRRDTALWNAFKRLASGCSADEKAQLFHDMAARIARLDRSKSSRELTWERRNSHGA